MDGVACDVDVDDNASSLLITIAAAESDLPCAPLQPPLPPPTPPSPPLKRTPTPERSRRRFQWSVEESVADDDPHVLLLSEVTAPAVQRGRPNEVEGRGAVRNPETVWATPPPPPPATEQADNTILPTGNLRRVMMSSAVLCGCAAVRRRSGGCACATNDLQPRSLYTERGELKSGIGNKKGMIKNVPKYQSHPW